MVAERQNVTILCIATGQPQPEITWSKLGGTSPKGRNEVTNRTLIIYNVAKMDAGTYICKAENIVGSAKDTVQLVIFSPLRFKERPPKTLIPVVGSTVRLPCLAESDLKPTLTWTKDGSSLPVGSRILQNNTLVLGSIKNHTKDLTPAERVIL